MREVLLVADDLKCRKTGVAARIVEGDDRRLAYRCEQCGHEGAAEAHFVRAGELAPHDFTIRRGSMPIRGMDPMGADFAPLYAEWVQAGRPYYNKRSFKD